MTLIKTYHPYIITYKGVEEGGFAICRLKAGDVLVAIPSPTSESGWGLAKHDNLDTMVATLFEEDLHEGYVVDYEKSQDIDCSYADHKKACCIAEELKMKYEQERGESELCAILGEMVGINQEAGLYDIVKNPNHYQLFPEHDLEVKDINKRILDRIEESSMDISYYEAGWLQQSLQYLFRCYAKNGEEDLEKAYETLGFVIESMKERKLHK